MTGFKRVRIQKSLEIRVKKSVLYCANTITSQGRREKKTMRKDENVTLWRSELKCSFCEVKVEIRAGHMFLFLCLCPSRSQGAEALCVSSATNTANIRCSRRHRLLLWNLQLLCRKLLAEPFFRLLWMQGATTLLAHLLFIHVSVPISYLN